MNRIAILLHNLTNALAVRRMNCNDSVAVHCHLVAKQNSVNQNELISWSNGSFVVQFYCNILQNR